MNRRALCWLAVAGAALGGAIGAPTARAQAQPSIEVGQDVAKPGEEITVTGECWGSCDEAGSPVPRAVKLELEGKGPDISLSERATPQSDGSFEVEVELPEDLEKGEQYRLVAESRDGLRATDKLFVGGRASSRDGDDDDDDGDGSGDEPDQASAGDEDECDNPQATTDPTAPAGVETQSAENDQPAEEQAGTTDEQVQPVDCESAAPPPSAPAGPFVLGESQDSDDSDGDSSSNSPDIEDNGDESDGDDDGNRDRKGKRALKAGDGDSDRDEDDEDSGGGGGRGGDNDRGQDSAPAAIAPTRAVRAAAGPAPQDVRETVPWALIGVLGALFAIGLGATYHMVGRWAPEPADSG